MLPAPAHLASLIEALPGVAHLLRLARDLGVGLPVAMLTYDNRCSRLFSADTACLYFLVFQLWSSCGASGSCCKSLRSKQTHLVKETLEMLEVYYFNIKNKDKVYFMRRYLVPSGH